MTNPYMTAGEAILWIATRDAAFAAGHAERSGIGIDVALATRPHYGHSPARRSAKSARNALGNKCRDGRIVALGMRGGQRKVEATRPEQIPMHAWAYLNIREVHGCMVAEPSNDGEYWHDLRFRRADVRRAFPPLSAPSLPTPTLTTPSIAAVAPQLSPGEITSEFVEWAARLSRRPTREEVEAFYRERRPNQGGIRSKARELLKQQLGPGRRGRRAHRNSANNSA
jgi:hypothetical protein